MRMNKILPVGLIIIFSALLMACSGPQGDPGQLGPAGPAGPQGPAGPPGDDATVRLEYVGSETCGECHETLYSNFVLTGHSNALTKIENGVPPAFPYDDITGGVEDPPEGYTWDDISYVIGGHAWKANFVDADGYLISGAEAQWNFDNEAVGLNGGWGAYTTGEEQAVFNLGANLTTGFRTEGRQNDLEGVVGTWAEEGIQCEACHGPGSRHASDPYGNLMVKDRSNQLCGECHVQGEAASIDVSGGFVHENQQYSELYNSTHFALQCITCHDPHTSAIYSDETLNPNVGIRQTCETCHWDKVYSNAERHFNVGCTDCHMPPTGRAALGNAGLFTGDLSSHLFSINTDPEALQFTEDVNASRPYLTLQWSCGHCHNDETASIKPIEELANRASGYHDIPAPTPTPMPTPTPTPAPEGDG